MILGVITITIEPSTSHFVDNYYVKTINATELGHAMMLVSHQITFNH